MSATGWSVLPVTVSLKGVQSALSKGLSGPLTSSGKKAAKILESSMKEGAENGAKAVEVAQRRAEKATQNVATAEKKVQDAKGQTEVAVKKVEAAELALETARSKGGSQVEQAEQKLKDLRESGKATAEQLKAAEDKLDQARSSAGSTVASKEAAVMSARQRSEKAADQLKSAEDNLVTAHRKAADAADNVKSATTRAANAMDDAGSSSSGFMSKIKRAFGGGEEAAESYGRAVEKSAGSMKGFAIGGAIGGAVASVTSTMTNSIQSLASEALEASDATDKFKQTLNFAGLDTSAIEKATAQSQAYADATVYDIGDIQNMTAQLAANGIKDYTGLAEAAGNLNAVAGGNADTFKSVGMVMTQTAGAGKLTTENWNQLADAIPGASGKLQEALLKNGAYTGNFREAMEKGEISAEEFNDAVSEIGTEPVAVEAAKSTATFEGMLGNLKATIVGSLAKALNDLKPEIGAIVNGFGDLAGKVLPVLVTAFLKAAGAIKSTVGFIRDNATWIAPLAAAVGAAAGAWALWTGAIKAWQAVTKIATGVQVAFNAVMAANPILLVAMAIAALVAGLVVFFTKTELGQKIWEGFVNVLKGAWDWIKNVFVAGWDWVKEAIPAAWQAVKDKTSEIWDGITGFLSDTWDAIKGTVENVWNGVKDFFTGLWDGIKEVFTLAVDGIKWYLESYWALITGTITLVWDGIKWYFTALWEGIKLVFMTAWNIISGFFTTAWQTFTGLVQAVWNGISSFFSSWWSALTGIFTGAWNGISSFLSGSWNAIRDLAVNVWNGIKDSITNAWEGVTNAISNAVSNILGKLGEMVSGAKSKIDEMVGKVTGMKDTIVNALSDAGTWLWNTGKAIVQGAIDGIMSAPNAIYDAIMSLVPDSLKGAVSSVVGWFSADGSIAYANGGVEAYANGGTRGEKHVAQIARPNGPFRVWAEPETGGEAYIPLALSKRARSKAILAKTAQIMGLSVVDHNGDTVSSAIPGGAAGKPIEAFANGGIRTPKEMLQFAKGQSVGGQRAPRSLEGAPYVWGGGLTGNWGDCSGAQSGLAAFMTGRSIEGRKFATGNEGSVLQSMGFTLGRGPSGTFRIGWFNGGPYGGHTAGTLPDGTNVEMGGNRGNGQIGGGAAAWNNSQFTDHAWIKGKADGPALTGTNPNRATTVSGAASGTTSGGDANVVEVDSANTAVAAAATETTPTTWSGIAGDFAKNWTEGMVQDALGVFGISDTLPPIFQAANQYYAVDEKGEGAEAVNAQIADAASDSTVATPAAKPVSTVEDVPEVKVGSLKSGEYKLGASFFWEEIAKAASERRMGMDAAVIAGATALVESGDKLTMFANNVVPESMKYKHDAVGYDGTSVGLFQQTEGNGWGTVAQRMNARASAGMFLNYMAKSVPGWKTMQPGDAAQAVQRSAYPEKYAGKVSMARAALAKFKGKLPSFSTGTSRVVGGSARGVDDVLSLLAQDEAVLTAEAADVLGRDTIAAINSNPQAFVRPTAQVATAPAVNGGGKGDTFIFQAVNTDELSTQYRRAAAGRVRGAIGAR